MASNSSSDGSVAKSLPGGMENELAAMVLSLTDNLKYIGASPFGGKPIGQSASPENPGRGPPVHLASVRLGLVCIRTGRIGDKSGHMLELSKVR